MWFIRFKQMLSLLLLPWLLSILIQFAGRAYLTLSFLPRDVFTEYRADVHKLIEVGLRFDIRTATILFGSLFILSLFTLFSRTLFAIWWRIQPFLLTLLTFLVFAFTLINLYFFKTYDRYIDIFIFGLIDDDTKAILLTLLHDYPILPIFIALIVVIAVSFWGYSRYQKIISGKFTHKTNPVLAMFSVVISLIFVVIGARGSINTFPLRESDVQISRYNMMNQFVPNGLIAFSWAQKNYRLYHRFPTFSEERANALVDGFFKQKLPASTALFDAKTAKKEAIEANPPHVIFSIMESLGTHLFSFDSAQNDLLGQLRKPIQDDWFFTRFVSEGDGTIDSLSRFFVRSPMSNISQSSAQYATFPSNMFQPFIDKGYKVIFVTSGNGAWRNLNQFLTHLGVSEFVEENTLQRLYPDAEKSAWGVPDEYLFKYAKMRLEQAEEKGEHLFIVLLSITNHPPYSIPKTSKFEHYALTDAQMARLSHFGSHDEVIKMLNTFHYSNDKLGKFIGWVKAQHQLKDKTIIAFTGDHNLRGIGYPDPNELALSHAVPFYLYVPKAYQINTIYDPTRIGSHKDILPTIYNLALSEANYYKMGCDLSAKALDPIWCGVGYNRDVMIDQYGAYSFQQQDFHAWRDINALLLDDKTEISPDAREMIERWRYFPELSNWQLSEQIK